MMRHKAREAFLRKLAPILGIDEEKLAHAFKDAAKATAEEAYQSGYLTKAQFEHITAHIADGKLDIFGHRWNHMARMHRGVVPIFESVANRLGIPTNELVDRLASGERLDEIARQKHVSLDLLKESVVGALKPEMDRLVNEGRITPKLSEAILHSIEESETEAKAA